MSVVRFLYNLLFAPALLFLLPAFILRMVRRGKYRHKFGQRLAIYSGNVHARIQSSRRIWVHGVSVGEVNIALKLITALREADPSLAFVLSTTTSTGFQLAARSKAPWLEPIYHPVDFLPFARRAVRTIRPSMLVLVEAEVWPNVLFETLSTGAPAALVNTRLSPRSEKRYRAARAITGRFFNNLDVLCLQEKEDLPRWTSLGVDSSRLRVTGSIKFDDTTAPHRPRRDFTPFLDSLGIPRGAPVLLGGSTFDGEEEILAEALIALRPTHPDLFLIIVPRHHERADSIATRLAARGLSVARRTAPAPAGRPDVLLVDTTGELASWYFHATVAFIGKSITAKGGQNPAEAVAAGVPVLFGPRMSNFATLAASLLRDLGAIETPDAASIARETARLLDDPALRATMARHAARSIETHRGATGRTVEILLSLLRSRPFA